jgi:hypothetical protein
MITVVKKQESAVLDIQGKPGPYCNNKDGTKIRLTATPAGGNFSSSPVGVIVRDDDGQGPYFKPEEIITPGPYTLKYAFNDGRSAIKTFTISQFFKVEFVSAKAVLVAGTHGLVDITIVVTPINGATYTWTYSSGGNETTQTTQINTLFIGRFSPFQERTMIKINVSVALNPCSATIEKTFDIRQLINIQ